MDEEHKTADVTLTPSQEAARINSEEKSWPWGFLSSIGYALLLFIMPQILIVLAIPDALAEKIDTGNNIHLFMFLFATELATFLMLVWLLRSQKKKLKDIYFTKPKIFSLLASIPAFGVYVLFSSGIYFLYSPFLSEETVNQEQDIGYSSSGNEPLELVFIFISLVVIAPLLEELLFRGFVLRGLVKSAGWPVAIIASSILFGFAHLQLNVGLDTFALGVVAATLVYATNNLWPSIMLHAIKNLVAFLLLFEFINLDV
jgi:membrane protease YdiL (CAAX protease family)